MSRSSCYPSASAALVAFLMWASGRLASRTQKTNARQSAFVWEVNSLTWQGNHRTRFTSQKTTTGSRRSEEGTSGLRSYSVNEPITGSSSRRGTRVPFDLHQGQLRQSSVARRATSSSSTGTGSDEIDAQNNDESAAEETPILRGLNPSQVKAVTQPVASVTRVVAGPGSGKTRVLTSRIAWLLQQRQTRQDRILGVTFTRKASGEMQNRLNKLLIEQELSQSNLKSTVPDIVEETIGEVTRTPPGLDRVTLGTFHSICAKILRWNGDYLSTLPSVIDDMSKCDTAPALNGNFNIMDQGEQMRLLRDVLTENNIDMKQLDLKPLQVQSAIGRCKSMLADGKNPFSNQGANGKKQSVSPAMQVAQKIYYPYREKLLSTNCIDFDDLIYLARELLLVAEDVRDRLQKRWNHVLVDEYQDTSRTQMDLIKLLTSTSLFVVGDADQSIYSWRGAHAGSLSDFEQDFKQYCHEGVSTVYLMENYRSTSNIVKAAQKVISASQGESGADKLRQEMIPKRPAGPSPRIIACADGKTEADFVVKTVTEKIASGEYSKDRSVAFVYRTNAQSRVLEEACVQRNLPYVIFGSATSFYKRQEIKDCLCFLRWLYNGWDRSSMLRAMETPKRGIGDTALREFDEYCKVVGEYWEDRHPETMKPSPLEVLFVLSGDHSWSETKDVQIPSPAVVMSSRSLKSWVEFSRQLSALRSLAKVATVEQVLTSMVDDLKIIPHLDKISKSKEEFAERQDNVRELQQATRRYTDAGPCLPTPTQGSDDEGLDQSPLGTFLDDVSLVTDLAESSESSDEERFVASLMTIHASKGMEFDTVFLVGIEDGTLPTNQALQLGHGSVEFEEEKRLCYVAMTRAKTELVMSWREEVPVFTSVGIRTVKRKRSRFLDVLVSKPRSNGTQKGSPINGPLSRMTEKAITSSARDFSSGSHRGSVRMAPPSVNKKAQQPQKLTGTGSVYAKKIHSGIAPVGATSRANQNQDPSQLKSASTTQPRQHTILQPIAPKKKVDSTLVFPVGSQVQHSQLGEGVVLAQSTFGKVTPEDVFSVTVEFRNGYTREFPVATSELSPIWGRRDVKRF